MTQEQFNQELDKLVTICASVIEAHNNMLDAEEDIEDIKKYSEELDTAIANFQRQCFYLMPEVKKKTKTEPEYEVLLEKLMDTIKLLS